MKDEQHFWPTWDSDKNPTGEEPAVDVGAPSQDGADDARFDQPTQATLPVEPDTIRAQPQGIGTFAADQTPTVEVKFMGATETTAYATDFPDGTTTQLPVEDGYAAQPESTSRKLRTGLGKAMMITGGVMGILVLIYAADLLLSAGDVPRGVTVAGVEVGGMSETEAEETLRRELEPRLAEPVTIKAGDVEAELDPTESGLGVDWQGTLDRAGQQTLSPITRLTSLFTTREVGILGQYDDDKLGKALDKLAEDELNHKKTEGTIKFEPVPDTDGEVKAVPVKPRIGQQLADPDGAVDRVGRSWLAAGGVELPVDVEPVKATLEGVQATLDETVAPAIAAPVTVEGDGADATLRPNDIGDAFTFAAKDDGSLEVKVDQEKVKDALQPQLASTEVAGKDAEIVFSGGRPTVEPSKEGRQIDWKKSLAPYTAVIAKPDDRILKAVYEDKKPKVTTEEAEAFGIKEVIGEFSTGGFAQDSGVNIRTVANQVNGAIVKPGDTFSLNGFTGPRTKAQGYVEAGIIQDGVPDRAVGGGISQFATTLYNAAYFAGLKDAGHKEHSYYISRYPVAREATVFQSAGGGIDIAFTNDASTGVAIQTSWSPSGVTVKIWGTKRYRVESITGDRTNIKKASKKTVDSKDCDPSPGIDGFTATDIRVLYDINSGAEVRRETRTVRYNPKPEIVCRQD
ncbi:MAG: VanW family protein [Haloechinothrix sp.]